MRFTKIFLKSDASDKTAVLQINVDDAYAGLDYLPEYYDYFQSSKHTTPYVLEENDKITAYVACRMVDDGETIVTRAGRVCPEERGKRVYKRLLNEVETIVACGGVTKTLSLVMGIFPSESFLKSYQAVATKEMHKYEYRRSTVADTLSSLTDEYRLKAKQVDTIPTGYLSLPYCNYLFPEGRIIVDWVPFRPLSGNIPLFKGKETVFLTDVSNLMTIANRKSDDINIQVDTAHAECQSIQGLLSASTLIKVKHDTDFSCVFDIFGTDFRSLKDHILFHLGRVQDTEQENINVMVITTKACESILLDEIMGFIGVKKITTGTRKSQYMELNVYEKAIK